MVGRWCDCCSNTSTFQKQTFLLCRLHVCLSPAATLPAPFIPTARPETLTCRPYRLLPSSRRVVLSLPFITLFTALRLCRSACSSASLIGTASVGAQILLSLPVSALHTGRARCLAVSPPCAGFKRVVVRSPLTF